MNVPIFWRHYASQGGVCLARVGAAALLKVPRSTLQHRIRKLGIVV